MLDGACSMGEEEPDSILWISAEEFLRLQLQDFIIWRTHYRTGRDDEDEERGRGRQIKAL